MNPGLKIILLDFRAVHDMVNRKILSSRLYQHYKVPLTTIQLLRDLFDHNVRVPMLLNFFIDEIMHLLNEMSDTSMHARSLVQ